MAVFVVVIGPPGAGKGTQAKKLSETLVLPHVSTGELFRDNIRDRTELGKRVEVIISGGVLVPDELTISLVRDRLRHSDCMPGVILDGFPRTPGQARALDEMLDEDGNRVVLVPHIRVRDEVILERLTDRRVDVRTGKTYHLKYNPPPPSAEVEQRPDDHPETVRIRIAEYYRNISPLLAYYTERGVLHEFDGEQPIKVVTSQLLAAVEAKTA